MITIIAKFNVLNGSVDEFSIFFNFLRTSNRLQMVTFKSNSLQKYRLYSAD